MGLGISRTPDSHEVETIDRCLDVHWHDTYFVVAHFHFIMVGGTLTGFLAALRGSVGRLPHRAVVVGTGGAARAVAAALLAEGGEVRVLGRNLVAGRALAAELAGGGPGVVTFRGDGNAEMAEALDGAELLVNATTLGGPRFPQLSPVSDKVELHSDLVVFDLIYWPRHTPLRRRAQAEGCILVDGLEMLVEQGALAFQAWTGMSPPRKVMREAANRAMEEIQ